MQGSLGDPRVWPLGPSGPVLGPWIHRGSRDFCRMADGIVATRMDWWKGKGEKFSAGFGEFTLKEKATWKRRGKEGGCFYTCVCVCVCV